VRCVLDVEAPGVCRASAAAPGFRARIHAGQGRVPEQLEVFEHELGCDVSRLPNTPVAEIPNTPPGASEQIGMGLGRESNGSDLEQHLTEDWL